MKLKKIRFVPRSALIGMSFAVLAAWGLSHWTELSFWAAFAIVAGSMFINGIVAQFEDEAPGGFNNPRSPAQPKSPESNSNDHSKTA